MSIILQRHTINDKCGLPWDSQNCYSRYLINPVVSSRTYTLQHCIQYQLYTAVSRENAFWLVQRNTDTSS